MKWQSIPIDVDRIKYEMSAMGCTMTMFAEKCGWDHSQFVGILKRARCRASTLEIIALALELPITELMADETAKINVMLDDGAKMPTRAHQYDAGLDLYSPGAFWIMGRDDKHKCYFEVDTGVHVQIPKGYVGDVKSKSGLMMNHNITTDGTVDCGYTGSVRVKLFNHGLQPVKIEKGQKIAQLVIKQIITPEPVRVDHLELTERGEGGFGSTGAF